MRVNYGDVTVEREGMYESAEARKEKNYTFT